MARSERASGMPGIGVRAASRAVIVVMVCAAIAGSPTSAAARALPTGRHDAPPATRALLAASGSPSGSAAIGAVAMGAVATAADDESGVDLAGLGWTWPAERFRIVRRFVAPAHEYGPGHRGVDLALFGVTVTRSPANGVIAFSGSVAGRPVLTIDHGGGLVTTLEPVASTLAPGAAVRRGDEVGALSTGGHSAPGTLHFGVRLDGEYINPMLLLGGVPRAVLLPCCD